MLKGILKKKLNNDKGFTLAELLIVVAIIAILVAVSIPVFTSQLNKARESTDKANIRAARAAATSKYLSEEQSGTFYYDAEEGILETDKANVKVAYGKSKKAITDSGATGDPEGNILKVDIGTDGDITLSWVSKS